MAAPITSAERQTTLCHWGARHTWREADRCRGLTLALTESSARAMSALRVDAEVRNWRIDDKPRFNPDNEGRPARAGLRLFLGFERSEVTTPFSWFACPEPHHPQAGGSQKILISSDLFSSIVGQFSSIVTRTTA